jgi:hypothetical protein
MPVPRQSSFSVLTTNAGMLRAILVLMLAGFLLSVTATLPDVEATGPVVETGGSGAAHAPTASEMLRGAYSPIEDGPEIAAVDIRAPMTVSEMLRGDLSPIVFDAA